jgi:similar to stage IV sporulation protein
MRSQLVTYVQGSVRVRIQGSNLELCLNRLLQEQIPAWDIRRISDEQCELTILVADFSRLRPVLKESHCRSRIMQKNGLPFVCHRFGRRKWFAFGALSFVLILFLLSSVIWSVDVVGNEQLSDETVLQAAAAQGLVPRQWKFRLPQPNELSARLTRSLPHVAWVGVQIQGTAVTIRVVESTVPKRAELQNPRHLVAAADGVITSILATRGNPVVNIHKRVKKGDVLISGFLGEGEQRQIVVADGEVRGMVWYEYWIRSPLMHTTQRFTGQKQLKRYLIIGNRAVQLTGYNQQAFDHAKTDVIRDQFQWRTWKLPIGWMTEVEQESQLEKTKLDPKEAKTLGMVNARADLLSKVGKMANIRHEKILQEHMDNGKVVMKVLFAVEMDIATEQPILNPS